jgi:hypothetical protein
MGCLLPHSAQLVNSRAGPTLPLAGTLTSGPCGSVTPCPHRDTVRWAPTRRHLLRLLEIFSTKSTLNKPCACGRWSFGEGMLARLLLSFAGINPHPLLLSSLPHKPRHHNTRMVSTPTPCTLGTIWVPGGNHGASPSVEEAARNPILRGTGGVGCNFSSTLGAALFGCVPQLGQLTPRPLGNELTPCCSYPPRDVVISDTSPTWIGCVCRSWRRRTCMHQLRRAARVE